MPALKALYATPNRRLVLITLLTVIFYELALAYGIPPFAWIFIVFACSALSVIIFVKKTWTTYLSITLLSVFVVCAVAEYYFYTANEYGGKNCYKKGDYTTNREKREPVLGYAPKAQAGQGHAQLFHGNTLIYDVVYTTNEHGWRITPVHPEADTAVLFFGCSLTLGEGVNDAESYPYVVGKTLGAKYQTFNFGFHGYGAHQFLSLLESRRLQAIFERYKNVHVFFLNIAGHELRSGGYSPWEKGYGPRYVLQDGKAVRKGIFAPYDLDRHPDSLIFQMQTEIYRTQRKSQLYRKIFMEPKTRELDSLRKLQTGILTGAQDFLRQYPNTRFSLLVYPGAEALIPDYSRAGLSVVDMRGFFPKDPTSPEYSIPVDGHPTPLAYELISKGIVDYIQHGEQAAVQANQ